MDVRLKKLLALEPRSLEDLVAQLCAIRVRQVTDPTARLPMTTLHLATGRDLTGFVLRVAETKPGERVLLVHDPGADARSPSVDVTYVPLSAIVTVTVHDALLIAPVPPAPSRLELKRRLAAIQEELAQKGLKLCVEVDWPSVAERDDSNRALGALVECVTTALLEVASDPMGFDAIKQKLRGATLGVGPATEARVVDGVFRAVTTLKEGDLSATAVKDALEQGL